MFNILKRFCIFFVIITIVFSFFFVIIKTSYDIGKKNGMQTIYLDNCQEAYLEGFNDAIETYED